MMRNQLYELQENKSFSHGYITVSPGSGDGPGDSGVRKEPRTIFPRQRRVEY